MFILELAKNDTTSCRKRTKKKTNFFLYTSNYRYLKVWGKGFVKELLEYKGKLFSIHLSWSYFFETVLSFILWVSDPSLLNVKMSTNEKHCNSFVW